MQKNSPVLYVVLFALVSLAIGIVSNVASSQFPDWLQPYLWLSWPLLAILVALAIALGIYDATRQPRDAGASKEIVVKFAPPPQEPQNISSPAPIPPAPYYAHSYALQENFTGRRHERTVLSEWFARDAQPVFVLDAI